MATPQVLSRKANGVAAAATSDGPRTKTKVPPEGEKVVVRRLPPGMTEDEFFGLLGDEWKVGNGKVDWAKYFTGKFTTDPSKVSRASRVYLHVKKRDELMSLQEAVEVVTAAVRDQPKDLWAVGALVALPALEISIYKKVPGGKKRSDARQGTIDQDPEFMAFLESLANPDAAKDGDPEPAGDEAGKGEKVTTTPLVEYLKEKKANKAKEAAAAKNAKHSRQESKGKASASTESKKKKGEKSDKPKETVKILTKKAASEAAAEAAKAVASQLQAAQAGSTSKELPKSRRAGIAAAARILQRDLGLSPGNAHRKARIEVAKAEAEAKKEANAATSTTEADSSATKADEDTASPTTSKGPGTASTPSSRTRNKRRGGEEGKGKSDKGTEAAASSTPTKTSTKTPVILMKKKGDAAANAEPTSTSALSSTGGNQQNSTANAPTGPKASASKQGTSGKKNSVPVTPTPGATRAFVKHVSASQGVTEATLKEALLVFGSVLSIEVDRRKGFAYAEFQDPEGLAKAMASSPVAVGQTTVQILERKETPAKKEKATPASNSAVNSKGTSQAETSSGAPSAAPTGPAAEGKSGGERRGGRRRGGRGRGGDKEGGAKESAGSKGTEGGTAAASIPAVSAAG